MTDCFSKILSVDFDEVRTSMPQTKITDLQLQLIGYQGHGSRCSRLWAAVECII